MQLAMTHLRAGKPLVASPCACPTCWCGSTVHGRRSWGQHTGEAGRAAWPFARGHRTEPNEKGAESAGMNGPGSTRILPEDEALRRGALFSPMPFATCRRTCARARGAATAPN